MISCSRRTVARGGGRIVRLMLTVPGVVLPNSSKLVVVFGKTLYREGFTGQRGVLSGEKCRGEYDNRMLLLLLQHRVGGGRDRGVTTTPGDESRCGAGSSGTEGFGV